MKRYLDAYALVSSAFTTDDVADLWQRFRNDSGAFLFAAAEFCREKWTTFNVPQMQTALFALCALTALSALILMARTLSLGALLCFGFSMAHAGSMLSNSYIVSESSIVFFLFGSLVLVTSHNLLSVRTLLLAAVARALLFQVQHSIAYHLFVLGE